MCMGPFAYGRPHVTRSLGDGSCSGWLTCLSVFYTSVDWCAGRYLKLMGLCWCGVFLCVRAQVEGRGDTITATAIPRFQACFIDRRLFQSLGGGCGRRCPPLFMR